MNTQKNVECKNIFNIFEGSDEVLIKEEFLKMFDYDCKEKQKQGS